MTCSNLYYSSPVASRKQIAAWRGCRPALVSYPDVTNPLRENRQKPRKIKALPRFVGLRRGWRNGPGEPNLLDQEETQ